MIVLGSALSVTPSSLVGTQWHTASGQTLLFSQDSLSGFGGCNTYGAHYTQEKNGLRVLPMHTTRMACDPVTLKSEAAFLAAIRSGKLEWRGNQLFVGDHRLGKGIVLRRDTLLKTDIMLEDKTKTNQSTQSTLGVAELEGKWRIESLSVNGQKLPLHPESELRVLGEQGNWHVSGFAGCNSWSGALETEEKSRTLRAPVLSLTRMACEDMHAEQAVLQLLRAPFVIGKKEAKQLTLQGSGVELTLAALR